MLPRPLLNPECVWAPCALTWDHHHRQTPRPHPSPGRPAASAAFHKSPAVCVAVMKFFLGQDAAQDDGGDSDDEGAAAAAAAVSMPSKQEFYKANKQVRHRARVGVGRSAWTPAAVGLHPDPSPRRVCRGASLRPPCPAARDVLPPPGHEQQQEEEAGQAAARDGVRQEARAPRGGRRQRGLCGGAPAARPAVVCGAPVRAAAGQQGQVGEPHRHDGRHVKVGAAAWGRGACGPADSQARLLGRVCQAWMACESSVAPEQ